MTDTSARPRKASRPSSISKHPKRTSLPPALALNLKASSASISSSSTLSSLASRRQSAESAVCRRRNLGDHCAFCGESLAGLLGESVELSCGDVCHGECLDIMFDRDYLDSLPVCNICGEQTRCADDTSTAHSSMLIHDVLWFDKPLPAPPADGGAFELGIDAPALHISVEPPALAAAAAAASHPVTPLNQMIPDTLKDPLPDGGDLEVAPAPVPYDQLRTAVLTPMVTWAPASPTVTLARDGAGAATLTYRGTVQAPAIHSRPAPSRREVAAVRAARVQIKQHLAATTTNWQHHFFDPAGPADDLVMFDFLQVSTNGSDWDCVCCVLFQHILLLVDGTKLIGQVLVQDDVTAVRATGGGLVLDLGHDAVLALHLRHHNPIIVAKWDAVLHKMVAKQGANAAPASMFQLSSNAWEHFRHAVEVPPDVVEFSRLMARQGDLPPAMLLQAVPAPDPLPLNMIVSIPLVNVASGMSNSEYKAHITATLMAIKASLRPIDKLGLIMVGTDSRRNPNRAGAFIGCVEPSWDGWDRVIDDIKVSDNTRGSHTIFHNELHELRISFEKCMDLFPFIPRGAHNINKLLVLNCNNYAQSMPPAAPATSAPGDNTAAVLARMIASLSDKLSISVVRIGARATAAASYVQELVARPSAGDGPLTVAAGTTALRYDTFDAFRSVLAPLVAEYQSICIPTFSISIAKNIGTQPMVFLDSADAGDGPAPVAADSLTLSVKDLRPGAERHVVLTVRVAAAPGQLQNTFGPLVCIPELPVFDWHAQWLGDSSCSGSAGAKLAVSG